MIHLPVSDSTFSLGAAKHTNNVRAEASVTNSKIAASFILGYCSSAGSSSDATCRVAASDVPLVSGSFDFATFCPAF
jgi:hypothetical protein